MQWAAQVRDLAEGLADPHEERERILPELGEHAEHAVAARPRRRPPFGGSESAARAVARSRRCGMSARPEGRDGVAEPRILEHEPSGHDAGEDDPERGRALVRPASRQESPSIGVSWASRLAPLWFGVTAQPYIALGG